MASTSSTRARRPSHRAGGLLVSRVGDDDVGVDIVEDERATRHRAAGVDRDVAPAELARGEHRGDLRRGVGEQRSEGAGAACDGAIDGVRDLGLLRD